VHARSGGACVKPASALGKRKDEILDPEEPPKKVASDDGRDTNEDKT